MEVGKLKKMKLGDVIIGLMAMIMATIVVLTLVVDMYSSEGYDIDLNATQETAKLGEIQEQARLEKEKITTYNSYLKNRTAGQPGAELPEDEITQGSLMSASSLGLTKVLDYVETFQIMVGTMLNSIGISDNNGNSPIMWFIIGSMVVTVVLLLLSVFFFRWI